MPAIAPPERPEWWDPEEAAVAVVDVALAEAGETEFEAVAVGILDELLLNGFSSDGQSWPGSSMNVEFSASCF